MLLLLLLLMVAGVTMSHGTDIDQSPTRGAPATSEPRPSSSSSESVAAAPGSLSSTLSPRFRHQSATAASAAASAYEPALSSVTFASPSEGGQQSQSNDHVLVVEEAVSSMLEVTTKLTPAPSVVSDRATHKIHVTSLGTRTLEENTGVSATVTPSVIIPAAIQSREGLIGSTFTSAALLTHSAASASSSLTFADTHLITSASSAPTVSYTSATPAASSSGTFRYYFKVLHAVCVNVILTLCT